MKGDYIVDYYNKIKEELIKNEVNKKVKTYSINQGDLNTYYNVGKLLSEAGKHYGEGIIKEYSNKLTIELGKGYSPRNLRNMRQFFVVSQKWQSLTAKLSWTHLCEILWFDEAKMLYYIKIVEKQNISTRQLRDKIKSKEYERLPEETRVKLINDNNELNITDLVKDPIVIKNSNYEEITEYALQKSILEDIPAFLDELGEGFTFIKNEYPIKMGNNYNYIDILLFNYIYNCFVVVELKVTKLRKEHIGQIMVYMNYIDRNLKTIKQDKTIGLIVCKENNKFIIDYSTDKRIIAREYELV